jgi:hypothetical protein
MKQFILTFLFGERAIAIPFKNGVTTRYPQERPTFDEWCKQLKVSCLHGKSIVCMD